MDSPVEHPVFTEILVRLASVDCQLRSKTYIEQMRSEEAEIDSHWRLHQPRTVPKMAKKNIHQLLNGSTDTFYWFMGQHGGVNGEKA